MIIPHQSLSSDAIQGLLEEFASRDGTDYGEEECDLATKVGQLREQLLRGDIVIVFDPLLESVTLLTREDARQFERQLQAGQHDD